MRILVLFCCFAAVLGWGLFGCGQDDEDDPTPCLDQDGDGYGSPGSATCEYPVSDCDDTEAGIHPNAPELCDGMDNQCPGDTGHGLVDDDAVCRCSFEGGSYLFEIEKVETDCPGIEGAALFSIGTLRAPMELPGFGALPTRAVDIRFGSPLGSLLVRFFSGGDDIRMEAMAPVEASLEGLGTLPVSLTGAFCPDRDGGVLAEFFLSVGAQIPCQVFLEAAGTP